jgi:methanol---5-hydroxybenzimidazolylcobamide Co-methyltransferase
MTVDKTQPSGGQRRFSAPVITDSAKLMFGRAPHPVKCGLGLEIGAGRVFPEINFTLPPMVIEPATWTFICEIYDSIVADLLARTRDLAMPGLVIEFEQLPPMTAEAAWGAELTRRIKTQLVRAHEEWGLAAALRVTIVDLRDEVRPPQRRRGPAWERMCANLEQSAAAGADMLSIESTGGKEIHDAALTHADLAGIVFALGVLGPRDMAWLWDEIVRTSRRHQIVASGDTACGFANTAMQLAGRQMLPEVLAALVRSMTSVRSLVAYERGAVGPSKDCAYEGPVMKAITGVPISMEGRSAACAHLSPIGNIAAATADLWSNESVQDTPLLSGRAPVASLESLIYDCRLMNAALARGSELELRDLHVVSDAGLSPQAAVLTPEITIALAQAITAEEDPYRRVLAAGRVAFEALERGAADGSVAISVRERRWLEKLRRAFDALPPAADGLVGTIMDRYRGSFDPVAYGLEL